YGGSGAGGGGSGLTPPTPPVTFTSVGPTLGRGAGFVGFVASSFFPQPTTSARPKNKSENQLRIVPLLHQGMASVLRMTPSCQPATPRNCVVPILVATPLTAPSAKQNCTMPGC